MADDVKTVVTERVGMQTDVQLRAVTVVPMSPWKIVLVRASRVYLQSLVGFLLATGSGLAAATGMVMPAQDFFHLLMGSASLALAPATVSLLQNIIELLARLDASNPTLRA